MSPVVMLSLLLIMYVIFLQFYTTSTVSMKKLNCRIFQTVKLSLRGLKVLLLLVLTLNFNFLKRRADLERSESRFVQ